MKIFGRLQGGLIRELWDSSGDLGLIRGLWLAAGLGSHASLAESLANGTVPAKAMAAGLGSHASLAESLAYGTVPAKASNFIQLQQHIDDLTKEKFELVRGLKEQQKMAAGLSEENLFLTEDFNRQVICTPITSSQHTNLFLLSPDVSEFRFPV